MFPKSIQASFNQENTSFIVTLRIVFQAKVKNLTESLENMGMTKVKQFILLKHLK